MGVPSAPAPDAHRRGVFLLSVGAGGGGAGTAVVEVEVADVKRVNGLTTDLQMFAHKTLRIPVPGRHPPAATATATAPSHPPPSSSPAATHRPREWATRRPPKNSALDPLLKPPQSTVAPSMDLLQNYYGLARPPKGDPENEGTEMATYSIGQHTKARSLSTGFSLVNGEVDDAEKPIRRRQKSDAEFSTREGNSGGVLMKAGPGLALRPKSGSRPEINNSQQDLVATAVPSYGDGLQAVRKSSSTPEFQDSDNSIASVWLKSKWNLKPDAFTLPLPILLLDSIPKPIFDTFPKQIAAWRNKAARD
ncbi:hypothetical protein OsJ_09129 [Oryza sativa Japonica Group]|uniref:Uncharacterized protein n=1 Tax=Oryza sativa subsp. japonica TaxID=39947 RepID=B9FAE0_ORYSJ|nr:hypothetical protein OsJ_09129 [Oryza sativa Japonica Group]